ncbi:MAG TPA: cation-translocating P-type ATPase [Streptosporangiaceae bacterium]|nr:cation-translocating P-type ATPase [Streptosporangiaceae bacterium]
MSGAASAAGGLVRDRYRVAGGCLDCAGDVAGLLRGLPGAREVEVLGAAGVVVIGHDGRVTPELVVRRAAGLGIGLSPAGRPSPAPGGARRGWWRSPRLALLAAALALLLAGLAAHLARQHAAATGLYLATLAAGGIFPVRSAWQVLARRRLSIGTLLVAGAIGALALGEVAEAAMLVVVFSLGGVMEDYVADRARGSIRALMSLAPPVAALLHPDGTTAQIPVEELQPGELVLVRPGERLPTDGQVTAGSSWTDQSPVTGESIPAEVTAGSQVFGGTLNGPGALTIEVTKPYRETVLARVIEQVEQAQASRGTTQRFADRFGSIYTPVMFTLAALIAIGGPDAGLTAREAVYRGLVVLVVSCSCALVISVPTAVIAAISRGAREGILIKGGIHLETLARVRTVALDKTGTLTAGQPRLTSLIPLDGRRPETVLAFAAAAEAASEHPLAAAILDAAAERRLTVAPAPGAQATPGTGIHAVIDGHQVFVGRPPDPDNLPSQARQQLAALQTDGKTTVLVTIDGHPAGLLGIADQLRPEAARAVTALRRLGISHVVMLTGDNPATATAIAQVAGIGEWRASLLPDDKTAAVAALRSQAGPVAMVGDGINDAPALATADVGIAIGAAGTDVALETADIALMADDLGKLPAAITLARKAASTIRQNIALSLAAIAALDAAAVTGHMSLAAGLLLNEGSAVLIIANGLRLLRSEARRPAIPPATRSHRDELENQPAIS